MSKLINGTPHGRRNNREIPLPGIKELEIKIRSIPKENVRSLAAFLYLTGCRVREVIGIKRKLPRNLTKEEITAYIKNHGKWIVEPIRKSQIDLTLLDQISIRNAPTFKKKGTRPLKPEIPIYYLEIEKPFINIFLSYIENKEEDAHLWKFSEQYAHRIIKKNTDLMPHFFRSMRATTLRRYYEFDALDLKKFFNWSDLKEAMLYEQTDFSDLKRKMRKKLEENEPKT